MKNSYFLSKRAGTALMMSCLSLVVLLTSCIKEPKPEPTGEASVRFVNAVQGSSAQDVYINGTKKSAVPVIYGSVTSSFTITSGNNQFVFTDEGTTTGTGTTLNVPIGSNFYLYFARDKTTGTTQGTLVAYPLPVDATAPTTAKAKVRFFNLSAYLTNPIAIGVVGGTTLATSVAFGTPSGYYSVDPGAKLALTSTGVTTGDIDPGFVAGKIYTIWFDGSSATELNSHVIVEN